MAWVSTSPTQPAHTVVQATVGHNLLRALHALSYIRIPQARHQKIRRIGLSWAFPTVTSTLDFATNSGSEVLVASATDNGGLPSYPRPLRTDSRARKGATGHATVFQQWSGRVTNAAT